VVQLTANHNPYLAKMFFAIGLPNWESDRQRYHAGESRIFAFFMMTYPPDIDSKLHWASLLHLFSQPVFSVLEPARETFWSIIVCLFMKTA
jgi:hypothetical protein